MKTKQIFGILLLAAPLLFAQNNSLKLDLNKCVEMAMENNHDFKQAKLLRDKAEEQVSEAYGSSLFPSIDGSVNYNRAIKRAEFIFDTPFFSGRFPVGSANTLTASVSATQPLFSGAMFLAVKIAETFASISKKSVEYSRTQLVMNVKQVYYNYLLSGELVKLAEIQKHRAEVNLSNTKKLYDAGLVPEYDYIKANVQYQNTIPALMESNNQRTIAANNLKLVLGLELETDIEVIGELSYKPYDLPSFEEGISLLMKQNKLLQQKELDVQMKDYTASYQFTEHLPKINAFGNWQAQAQEEDERAFGDWRYINSVSVGVTLSVPIFHGFTINSRVEQAEIDLKVAQEGLSKVKKDLKNQYENTVLLIGKTKKQVDAYKLAVEESERGFDIATKRFNSGLGTQLEVTGALYESTLAKVNYLKSVYDYLIYGAQLDLVLGKSIEEIKL